VAAVIPGVTIVAQFAPPLAGVANAARACAGGGGVGNFGTGYTNVGVGPTKGVQGTLWPRTGIFCHGFPNPGSFFAGWTMLLTNGGIPPNGNGGYAQSGFVARSELLGNVVSFSQQTACSTCMPVTVFGTTPVLTDGNHTYKYWTSVENPSNWVDSYVGSTQLLRSGASFYWTAPYGIEMASEVTDTGADVPGTFSGPLGFSDLATWDGSTWDYSMPSLSTVNGNPPRWSVGPLGGCPDGKPCFATWTQNP
jgi:hypothetical protein